ncbi:MAG: fasciclin domain-containing protein [Pseudomonadota bacterium]
MNRFASIAAAAALTLGLAACGGTTETATPVSAPQPDIVDTAVAADDFNTLVAAVQAAGLVETLKGEGPFTVFAPTDAAFAALPPGTVDNLLKPENRDTLVSVLTYHVVAGKVMSGDIAGQTLSAPTVQGSALDIDATNGVRVNNATVVAADVEASNGVIHVIDTVLLP